MNPAASALPGTSDEGVEQDRLNAVQQRAERAERVLREARELHASLELAEVVDAVAAAAHRILGRPAALWLLDGERARAVGRSGGAMIGLGEERPLTGHTAERLLAAARHFENGATAADLEVEGNRLIVPLAADDELLGFVAAGPWNEDTPDTSGALLLHALAPHAASALRNARRHADMLRLSLTDPLVQLPNRRQLDFFLEKEFQAAIRGRPLSFVLFDLDHFKAYNDTHGHRAGDLALIKFADVLRAETRAMNLAARYGGEEFAAVLSSTTITGARAYGERVRRRVETVFAGALTVSSGVVEYSQRYATPADLVVAADGALYRAKQEGRNRVCVVDA